MDSPVFKLEKVVRAKSQEEMQDFEGPLDLILFLLGKNKMEIQDISIALICDQYLQWLEARKKMDLEVASEFIAMASHLIYLKTRMLLSIEDEEVKGEMDALIQSLEERRRSESYGVVKAAAMDSEGLLLLTNDGELMQRLIHPSFQIDKTYQVDVTGFKAGLDVELSSVTELDGERICPATVEVLFQNRDHARLSVVIHDWHPHRGNSGAGICGR